MPRTTRRKSYRARGTNSIIHPLWKFAEFPSDFWEKSGFPADFRRKSGYEILCSGNTDICLCCVCNILKLFIWNGLLKNGFDPGSRSLDSCNWPLTPSRFLTGAFQKGREIFKIRLKIFLFIRHRDCGFRALLFSFGLWNYLAYTCTQSWTTTTKCKWRRLSAGNAWWNWERKNAWDEDRCSLIYLLLFDRSVYTWKERRQISVSHVITFKRARSYTSMLLS